MAQLVKNPPAMWETWVQSLGWEDSPEKEKATHSSILVWRIPWTTVHGVARVRYYLGTKPHSQDNIRASLVAQLIKNLPAMWETWVQSLGWEDPLEKEKATHSSILAWRIPWTV